MVDLSEKELGTLINLFEKFKVAYNGNLKDTIKLNEVFDTLFNPDDIFTQELVKNIKKLYLEIISNQYIKYTI